MAPLSCYGEILGGIIFGAISMWLFLSGHYQKRELRTQRQHRDQMENLGTAFERFKADYRANGMRGFQKGLEAGYAKATKEILS